MAHIKVTNADPYNAVGGELLVSAYGTGNITISVDGLGGSITHALGTTAVAHQFNIILGAGDIVNPDTTNIATIDTDPSRFN